MKKHKKVAVISLAVLEEILSNETSCINPNDVPLLMEVIIKEAKREARRER